MAGTAPLQTALHEWHVAHGGRIVEFSGWLMPVQYSAIVEEHEAVRQRVGLFDISHMGRLRFRGPDALAWLELVTTNHVAALEVDQAQYSLVVNDQGGVLDDILVYRLADGFGLVCNAGSRSRVLDHFLRHKGGHDATLVDRTLETAMIAIQGPAALETLKCVFEGPLESLPYFHNTSGKLLGFDVEASRTGYTGEDGFELIVPRELAGRAWAALLAAGHDFGIRPCGLGARDTLRFEAAMPLYGHELSEQINPYAAGLGWAVKLKKGDFIGRDALRKLKADPGQKRVGLALQGKRIARQGATVLQEGRPVGSVTSGTFSPTLARSLAMALVEPPLAVTGTGLTVDVRGREEPAEVVPLPFYRRPDQGTRPKS